MIEKKEGYYLKGCKSPIYGKLSSWRNGYAILSMKIGCDEEESYCYLVNSEFEDIYHKYFHSAKQHSPRINRVIGGYYVCYAMEAYNYVTFPGQDRDTEYSLREIVTDIFDENGNHFNEEEMKTFLANNDIQEAIDYGENIVKCGRKFYSLDKYDLLFELPYEIEQITNFKNNECFVWIKSHFQDYVAIVGNAQIIDVLEAETFNKVSKYFDAPVSDRFSSYKDPDKIEALSQCEMPKSECFKVMPEPKSVIEKYLYITNPNIQILGYFKIDRNKFGQKTYGMNVANDLYYKMKDRYYVLDAQDGQYITDKLKEMHDKRPNFIEEIK